MGLQQSGNDHVDFIESSDADAPATGASRIYRVGNKLMYRGDGIPPTTLAPGVALDDELGQMYAEARKAMGDAFYLRQYPFECVNWIDPYVAVGAAAPIFVNGTPSWDGARLDIATGGSATGSAFGRILGTKVPTGATPNWSTIAPATTLGGIVENVRVSPWYMSTWAAINQHADPADAAQKWVMAMTWVNTDPRTAVGQIGLVYTGSPASLRIRASVAASPDNEQDLGWGPTAGQADVFHRFSLAFDGTSLICYVDGVLQGTAFGGLGNVAALTGFPIFGLHCGGNATNYQCEWAGHFTVATRVGRGR